MLVDLHQTRGEMKSPWIGKYVPQHQTGNPVSFALTHDIGARILHHLAEMDAGRAGGLACAAIEAPEHVLTERIGDARAAFVKRTHQINAAARRIHLTAEYAIRRAGRQTQSAVDAIEVKLILRRCGGQGSTSFPDRMSASFPALAASPDHVRRRFRHCGALLSAPVR